MSNLGKRTTIKPMRRDNMERALLRLRGELHQVITAAPERGHPESKVRRLRQGLDDVLQQIDMLWDPCYTPRAEGMKGPVDG